MNTNGKLNFATSSDHHVHHPRVPTNHICNSLTNELMLGPGSKDLDYTFLVGDFFDRVVSMASGDSALIISWVAGYLRFCADNNIKVRILEGTPSHDRGQSILFTKINEALGDNAADLRYHDKLTIDYEEDDGLYVLYVPDEWHHDPDEVKRQVQDLLVLNGIDQVHITALHGMARHQVKEGLKIPAHDPDFYCDITKWFITAGHIHTRSRYRNYYAQGSLERLSMNEEEDKGHYRFTVNRNDPEPVSAKFVPNRNAMFQKTVDIRGMKMEEALAKIAKTIEGVTFGFCRLFVSSELAEEGIMRSMAEMYPHLKWTSKPEKVKGQSLESAEVFQTRHLQNVKPINKQTIHDMLTSKITELTETDKKVSDWTELTGGEELLEKLIGEVING